MAMDYGYDDKQKRLWALYYCTAYCECGSPYDGNRCLESLLGQGCAINKKAPLRTLRYWTDDYDLGGGPTGIRLCSQGKIVWHANCVNTYAMSANVAEPSAYRWCSDALHHPRDLQALYDVRKRKKAPNELCFETLDFEPPTETRAGRLRIRVADGALADRVIDLTAPPCPRMTQAHMDFCALERQTVRRTEGHFTPHSVFWFYATYQRLKKEGKREVWPGQPIFTPDHAAYVRSKELRRSPELLAALASFGVILT